MLTLVSQESQAHIGVQKARVRLGFIYSQVSLQSLVYQTHWCHSLVPLTGA